MYGCYMFDLGGTLINTIYALTYTINLTLKKCGLGPIENEQTKVFVGDGYQKFVEQALHYYGDVELAHRKDTLMTYDALFKEHYLYRVEAYDGMEGLLDAPKARGTKIAVVTNKSHDRAIENMEIVFGKDYSDETTGEQGGVRCKPDPTMALDTAKALEVDPSECLYFGDTSTDMRTGVNAGMDTVGVLWGFRDREELETSYPEYIIEHPSDILPAIEAAE